MATSTPRLNLVKPDPDDIFNVNQINANMDRVDVWATGDPDTLALLQNKVDSIEAPWIDYTPTGVVVGNGGSITGRYRKIGKIIQGYARIQLGSNPTIDQPIRITTPPNLWPSVTKYKHNPSSDDLIGAFCGKLSGGKILVGSATIYWVGSPTTFHNSYISLDAMATEGLTIGKYWERMLGAGSEPWYVPAGSPNLFPNAWFSITFEYETD